MVSKAALAAIAVTGAGLAIGAFLVVKRRVAPPPPPPPPTAVKDFQLISSSFSTVGGRVTWQNLGTDAVNVIVSGTVQNALGQIIEIAQSSAVLVPPGGGDTVIFNWSIPHGTYNFGTTVQDVAGNALAPTVTEKLTV